MAKHVPGDDPATLRRIAALYAGDERMSMRALAQSLGWSYGLTHSRLHQAAAAGLVAIRPRGARVVSDAPASVTRSRPARRTS